MREEAVKDARFCHVPGAQWEQDVIERRGSNRPRYEVNIILQSIRQINSNQLQNEIAIKTLPAGGEATKDTAKIISGMIGFIERMSGAPHIYSAAYLEMITGGYGAWRVGTRYEDGSFDQEIFIDPIPSASTRVYFDPAAIKPDMSDARYCFVVMFVPKEDYPDGVKGLDIEFDYRESDDKYHHPYDEEDTIALLEYWVKVPYKKTLVMLDDGRVVELDEMNRILDELAYKGIYERSRRVQTCYKVHRYVLSRDEVLIGPELWNGSYLPIVPVFGTSINIAGMRYVYGRVRHSKDSQRIYNYQNSALIETLAQTPKDPIYVATDQVAGIEKQFTHAIANNQPVVVYKHVDGVAPPTRGGAPAVQEAMMSVMAQARSDVYTTSGVEPASHGNIPQLESGEAIRSQQEMGDRSIYEYHYNLERAVELTGRILADLIPKLYDSERLVTVATRAGVLDTVSVNKPALNELNEVIIDEESGTPVLVNNLAAGKYAIETSTGPSYATERLKKAHQILTIAQTTPIVVDLLLDKIIDMSGLNDDEVSTRIRKHMIKNGLADPTPEEAQAMTSEQDQLDQQVKVAQQRAILDTIATQAQLQAAEAQEAQAKVQQTLADAGKKVAETDKIRQEISQPTEVNKDAD